jgi:hypothetical protein
VPRSAIWTAAASKKLRIFSEPIDPACFAVLFLS